MNNTNGNVVILLIIAMLILGLIIFSIGNKPTGSRVTQPVTTPTSKYNIPNSAIQKFDLRTKKSQVHETIQAGIRTIDNALTELSE
ncbi:MAG: hypothetical protein HOJ48_00090 [Desulfobacula sp.]|jgi:hypothetical protein|nr:hypothetical protein [Desulfobacula sp.]